MSEENDILEEGQESTEAFSEESLMEKFGENINEEEEDVAVAAASEEESEELLAAEVNVEGTELDSFESAEIEEEEFLTEDQVVSIVESILFSTDRPVSPMTIKAAFKGTQVKTAHIRRAIESLTVEYADHRRGICMEEVNGGYQLRTKVDNANFLRRMVKARPFKLSGPALEVLAIIAYKQPLIKAQVDEIRGVESGHLLRALMEKGLVHFAGKSEFPGKPMLYQTTRKFLEIFGLRNLKELPSLSEIDELIPEGIGEEQEKESLGDLTDKLSEDVGTTYSQGEEELMKISEELSDITTSSDFFEQEKARQKAKKEEERAQDIRDALVMGEDVADKDKKWLEKYETRLTESVPLAQKEPAPNTESESLEAQEVSEQADEDSLGSETLEAQDEVSEESGVMDSESLSDKGLSVDGLEFERVELEVVETEVMEISPEDSTESMELAAGDAEDFEDSLSEEGPKESLASQRDRIGKVMTDLSQALSQFDKEDDLADDSKVERYEEDLSVFEEGEEQDSDPEASV